jgi:hypothetical protein
MERASISPKADLQDNLPIPANPQRICRYNPGSGFAPIAVAGSNPSHSLR